MIIVPKDSNWSNNVTVKCIRRNIFLPLQVSSSNHPIPYCVSAGSDCKSSRSQKGAPEWTPPRSRRWSSIYRRWSPPVMEGAIPFEIINDSAEPVAAGLPWWIYVNKPKDRKAAWNLKAKTVQYQNSRDAAVVPPCVEFTTSISNSFPCRRR